MWKKYKGRTFSKEWVTFEVIGVMTARGKCQYVQHSPHERVIVTLMDGRYWYKRRHETDVYFGTSFAGQRPPYSGETVQSKNYRGTRTTKRFTRIMFANSADDSPKTDVRDNRHCYEPNVISEFIMFFSIKLEDEIRRSTDQFSGQWRNQEFFKGRVTAETI